MDRFESHLGKAMENKSGFNLETALGAWRAQLAHAALNKDNVRELEAHLRESFARLQETGRAEEDAFALLSNWGNSGTGVTRSPLSKPPADALLLLRQRNAHPAPDLPVSPPPGRWRTRPSHAMTTPNQTPFDLARAMTEWREEPWSAGSVAALDNEQLLSTVSGFAIAPQRRDGRRENRWIRIRNTLFRVNFCEHPPGGL